MNSSNTVQSKLPRVLTKSLSIVLFFALCLLVSHSALHGQTYMYSFIEVVDQVHENKSGEFSERNIIDEQFIDNCRGDLTKSFINEEKVLNQYPVFSLFMLPFVPPPEH